MRAFVRIRSRFAESYNRALPEGDPRRFDETAWSGPIDFDKAADHVGEPRPRTEDDRLNLVFRLFNRVTAEDADRLDVWAYRLPSLSVGDEVRIGDGPEYRVAHVGFEPAEPVAADDVTLDGRPR